MRTSPNMNFIKESSLENLIHIVPQLPPNINGLGDYATIIGKRVQDLTNDQINSYYVSAGWKREKEPDEELISVNMSGINSPDKLTDTVLQFPKNTIEQAIPCVILHYSGYGYQKRGTPYWLLKAIKQLKRQDKALKIITVFHELYARGYPWQTSFWLYPFQRHIVSRLARISDGIITNRSDSVQMLQKHASSSKTPVVFSPTFSNVGEPERLPRTGNRERIALVFGRRKKHVYENNFDNLHTLLNTGHIQKIIDIGPVNSDLKNMMNQFPIDIKEVLPASEISTLLLKASFGLLSYPASRLSKSGVMAAYMSHGLPLLLFDEKKEKYQPEPYREGKHYLRYGRIRGSDDWPSRSRWRTLGKNGFDVYSREVHSRHSARRLLLLLKKILGNDG